MKVETWNTRFGKSVRSVARGKDGKFINNKSAKQLIKLQDKATGTVYIKIKAGV